jgi:folylpolyglutamate synthase/dihydropteroate synthase
VGRGLDSPRALPVGQLLERLHGTQVNVAGSSEQLGAALMAAQKKCAAGEYQRVLVFGSFLIVGPALDYLEYTNGQHVGSR